MKKYDVGVFGVWSGCNYGSIATYYALNQVLKSMGKSVLMIDKPILTNQDVERGNTHSRRFATEHYDISEQYPLDRLHELNAVCDAFVVGSDQIWNYGISKHFGKAFYLDFVAEEKKKIAYGVSFGHGVDFAPNEERAVIANYMSKFEGISVRESDGVRICKDDYGIRARQVLDPVFLADPAIYQPLIEKSTAHEEKPFLATYILDPTPEKREAILHLSEKLGGIKIVNMLDGLPWLFKKNRDLMNLPNCIENLQVEDWLYYLSKAKFVVTDSCHGASFALIFKKNFVSISNKSRGFSRFKSLAQLFNFSDRLVTDPKRILTDESLLTPIDYNVIDSIMETQRTECYAWLKSVLEQPKKTAEELIKQNVLEKLYSISPQANPPKKESPKTYQLHVDVQRCQMVAALLRDYGIKHVVLSSGTRHVELVRFLEANSCFTTHNVLDERSAGFFALGLATRLKQPVAVCCTSGTAASNYLTSVSEAFYQHVPVIFITADRYPHLLNQREDQMVPQENMFGSVCLKSVTLPTRDDAVGTAVARRLICEAISESTHRTPGPVHINIPIISFNRLPLPKEAYSLKDVHFNRILRYSLHPDRSSWKPAADKLAKNSKILVIYGQNAVLNQDEQRALDNFATRFNCVICTDHLSNVRGAKCVHSYNMVRPERRTSEIVKKLKPDIVITLHGANVSAIRDFALQSGNFAHWDVAPNGVPADPFKRLTRIFECSPTQFFKRMNVMVGDRVASSSFYDLWKSHQILNEVVPTNYSQRYAVYHTIKKMPCGSLLHLGNSNTIRMANSYNLNDGIEVYCNRGTNGIDGSASSFMGQAAVSTEPCYLLIGDLSFFYDMNSLWNKKLGGNIRIMLFNNSGAGLLRHHNAKAITYKHDDVAEGWVKSLGFTYLSSRNKEEFDANIARFTSDEDVPMFFEVFC